MLPLRWLLELVVLLLKTEADEMLRLVMPLTTLALPLPLRFGFPEVMVDEQQVDGCVEEDNDLDDVDKNDDKEMLFGDFDTESKEGLVFVVEEVDVALVLGVAVMVLGRH